MSSAFQDPAAPPDDATLAATLGAALPTWERLVAHTLTVIPRATLPGLAASGLPPALVREIAEGRRLPEGRAARMEVRGEAEADLVIRLLELSA
ncbi:MAG: hypothetical protein ABIO70_15665 [Pseudomonadota bacterium]